MERDFYNKVGIIEKVIDKTTFENLYYTEPFVCKLILDRFKSYLDDPEFDSIERQIILLRFLKNNYPLELSRDVVEYCKNCSYAEDYNRVIMEWNYDCSDFIKQSLLLDYDSSLLALDYDAKNTYDNQRKELNKQIDIAKDLTKLLLERKEDNDAGR